MEVGLPHLEYGNTEMNSLLLQKYWTFQKSVKFAKIFRQQVMPFDWADANKKQHPRKFGTKNEALKTR